MEEMSSSDFTSEAELSELLHHSLSASVKYSRSVEGLEYCLKWKRTMYSRRSSKVKHISKDTPTPCSDEEPIERKLRGKKRKRGQKKNGHSVTADTDEETGRDILDLLNETNDMSNTDEEDEGTSSAVADEKDDKSDKDSDNSSICSGPSQFYHEDPYEWRARFFCLACQKLFQKARKMKTPIKSKLLDKDPKSLTCDQWLLTKEWKPRKQPNARGDIEYQVRRLKKRLQRGKQTEQTRGGSSICPRPLVFLQRSQRCLSVPEKREKKRRKRRRNDSQGSPVAKQKHLDGSSDPCGSQSSCLDASGLTGISLSSTSTTSENCGNLEANNPAEAHHVFRKCIKTTDLPTEEKSQGKTKPFREFLALLRGKTSMIVKEK